MVKTKAEISAQTNLCAVIGNPIAHSLSPAIHNAGYAALGLDFVYLAFRVVDLAAAIAGVRAMGNFCGLSVTIPHKVEIIKHLDEVAEIDRSIGSINTVVNESGRLLGLGTDGPGALKAISDAGVELSGKTVLMLGSGGAARAVSFNLLQNSGIAKLLLLGVVESELKKLAVDLGTVAPGKTVGEMLSPESLVMFMNDADVIVHCTPVGMHPQEGETLIPRELFRTGQVVFDIVYNPLETRLIKEAKETGLKVICGVEMFVNQALLQFERFTGEAAPDKEMRQVVMQSLQRS